KTTPRSPPLPVTGRPPTRISPRVGWRNPASRFRSVVLPQPDCPSTHTNSDAATAKLTSASAVTRPLPASYSWVTPRTSMGPGAPTRAPSRALDAGAQRAQALVDPLVPAVDLPDVADDRAPGGAQRGGDERHPGPDVGRDDGGAVEAARADHDRAVRIAQDDPGPHGDEAVHEEEPALVELLVDQHRPLALGGQHERQRGEIGGGGPARHRR